MNPTPSWANNVMLGEEDPRTDPSLRGKFASCSASVNGPGLENLRARWGDAVLTENSRIFDEVVECGLVPVYDQKTGKYLRSIKQNSHAIKSWLENSISMGDFQTLYGQNIQRRVDILWASWPRTEELLVRSVPVPDFRAVNLETFYGGTDVMLEVPERGAYMEDRQTTVERSVSVKKYGKLMSLTFEAWQSGLFMQQFNNMPELIVRSAANTIAKSITDVLVDTADWRANFSAYTTSTNALSYANLQTAIIEMSTAVEQSTSVPILIDSFYLVTGPALEMTAMEIMNGTTIGSTTVNSEGVNRIRDKIRGQVTLPWIPRIANSTYAPTMWALIANPQSDPCIFQAELEGHDGVEIFYRSDATSGSPAGPASSWSFDQEIMTLKGRIFKGWAAAHTTGHLAKGVYFSKGQA